jgi:hypothetical protein
MASLAKYQNKLYRVKWLGIVTQGDHKGKKRGKLVPVGEGEAVWVDGKDFELVDYVPKGESEK